MDSSLFFPLPPIEKELDLYSYNCIKKPLKKREQIYIFYSRGTSKPILTRANDTKKTKMTQPDNFANTS